MVQHFEKPHRVLRRKQVETRTGLSRSTLYLRIAEGSFPKPISLGVRAVGWLESDVDGWVVSRIEKSRNPRGKKA